MGTSPTAMSKNAIFSRQERVNGKRMFRQFPIVIGQSIREMFLDIHPATAGNEIYWRILQYLYFCPWWCEFTGQPVMNQAVVSGLTDVSVGYHAPRAKPGELRHFNAEKLLAPFERD